MLPLALDMVCFREAPRIDAMYKEDDDRTALGGLQKKPSWRFPTSYVIGVPQIIQEIDQFSIETKCILHFFLKTLYTLRLHCTTSFFFTCHIFP